MSFQQLTAQSLRRVLEMCYPIDIKNIVSELEKEGWTTKEATVRKILNCENSRKDRLTDAILNKVGVKGTSYFQEEVKETIKWIISKQRNPHLSLTRLKKEWAESVKNQALLQNNIELVYFNNWLNRQALSTKDKHVLFTTASGNTLKAIHPNNL